MISVFGLYPGCDVPRVLPLIDVKVLANLNGVLGRIQLRIGPDFVEILPLYWVQARIGGVGCSNKIED